MDRFHLDAAPPLPNKEEMRPTDQALVIDGAGPRLMRWGLTVDWSKQPLINARAETLAEKPTFRPLLEKRCLVPMTAYFEWRRSDDGAKSKKLKNRIAAGGGADDLMDQLWAFAGLIDGAAFTIITCPPAPAVAHVYNRMPVILDAPGAARWADAGQGFAQVADLLAPYAGDLTTAEERPAPPAQADLFH